MKAIDLELLMKSAIGGDKAAYTKLLDQLTPILLRFISKKVKSLDAAEDILQEVLISIHKARHTYDGKRPLMPWVYAIAKFRLSDHLRQLYGKAVEVNIEDFSDIEDLNVTNSLSFYESIRSKVKNLSGKQPIILELMHEQGFTTKEVAAKLGMKESAVKVAAHRAYKVLRKKLSA